MSDTRQRLAISITAATLLGLNFYVLSYGTVALPFGLCLLLTVASFCLTVAAVHKPGTLLPFLAGLGTGAAAASSLLTTPVLVVLVVWLARYTRAGDQRRKCLSFVGGAALPFIWLGLLAPRQVFFDLVEYHLFHRGVSGEYDPLELKRDLRLVRVDSGFGVGGAGSGRVVFHFETTGTERGTKIRVLSLRMVDGRARRVPGDSQTYILVLLRAVDAVCRRSRGKWLAANRFATVCMMANDPRGKTLDLFGRYAKNKEINSENFTVYIFWDRIATPAEPP